MVYLDYSATTPVSKDVLDSFVKANTDFIGNANSLHKLGLNIDNLINSATLQVAKILDVNPSEIIYTSGSSESNNLAIKGVCLKYKNRGREIITSHFEHSSVIEPLKYLKTLGYTIKYVESDEYGRVNLEHLKKLLTSETILVSINAVNSEIGILNPINEIGKILKEYPNCFYHVDMTQAIGKIAVDFENISLASFSAHKFYGLKGIGVLYKKEGIMLEPLFHGGKSTTVFRSGTPAHPLIVSLSKALRLATTDIYKNYEYVQRLNQYLQEKLKTFSYVHINSNEFCIPHILNISVDGVRAETMLHALEQYEIYISTKSACADEDAMSESVFALTKDKNKAKSSIRISLSYLTTFEELDFFVDSFRKCYEKLNLYTKRKK